MRKRNNRFLMLLTLCSSHPAVPVGRQVRRGRGEHDDDADGNQHGDEWHADWNGRLLSLLRTEVGLRIGSIIAFHFLPNNAAYLLSFYSVPSTLDLGFSRVLGKRLA